MTVAEKNQHTILRTINTLIWIFECWYILNHAQCIRLWIWWLGIHRAGRFAFLFRLTTIAIWNCIKITSWLRFTFTFRTDWIESLSLSWLRFTKLRSDWASLGLNAKKTEKAKPMPYTCKHCDKGFDKYQKLSSISIKVTHYKKFGKVFTKERNATLWNLKSEENLPQNLDREFHVRVGPLL